MDKVVDMKSRRKGVYEAARETKEATEQPTTNTSANGTKGTRSSGAAGSKRPGKSGFQSPSSSASSSPPSPVASMNPDDFSPPFDVIAELTDNRAEYQGDEWLSLPYFPSYIRTCIDRLRVRVDESSRPGFGVTAACCMKYGLEVIADDDDVKRLLEIKNNLDLRTDMDSEDAEELSEWFATFRLGAGVGSSSAHRQNIRITELLQTQLCEIAANLGVYSSTLAILCIAITLSHQTDAILPDRLRDLTHMVNRFFNRVEIRCRVADAWLHTITDQGKRGPRLV